MKARSTPSPDLRGDTLAGRLTRTLIVWVGGVWMVCVLGVVWYVDREINNNFDNELVEVSHRVFEAAVQEYERLSQDQAPGTLLIAPPQLFASDALRYQLVDGGERVLLRAAEAPPGAFDVPLAPGFANAPAWRVFTARHPSRAYVKRELLTTNSLQRPPDEITRGGSKRRRVRRPSRTE